MADILVLIAQVKTEMQEQIYKLKKEIGTEREARQLIEKEVEKGNSNQESQKMCFRWKFCAKNVTHNCTYNKASRFKQKEYFCCKWEGWE
jgi:hypothetical protein